MSESRAQVHHSVHTHTHVYTEPSQRGNNKISVLKRSSRDSRRVSTCLLLLCGLRLRSNRCVTQMATRRTIKRCKLSWAVRSCELHGCPENEKYEFLAAAFSKLITKCLLSVQFTNGNIISLSSRQ